MEEDMMMNVPSAPDMQGTPMPPDLSGQMQPQTEEVSQAEMQEAQGALMQIVQVINMLIEQGLNEDQIRAFLEQYGISEDELDQAGQLLGVDIDALLSGGQMQQPQEPMMMAGGGPGISDMKMRNTDPIDPPVRMPLLNNQPRMGDRSPANQMFSINPRIEGTPDEKIFSLQSEIDNLMTSYNMLVRNNEPERAQAIVKQIDDLQTEIINIQSQMPMGLGEKKN